MAALTVQDLITDSLEEIEAVAAGDTPATADLTKGLAVLKRFVDGNNAHRGNIASLRIDTFTLTINKASYTIGIDPAGIQTADFNVARPVKIERANILLTSGGSTIRRKLNLLDDSQQAAITYQGVKSIPRDLYNDGGYSPFSTYVFRPIPDKAYQFETYTWQRFSQSALADILSIPDGLYEYWQSGLAIRLATVYGRDPRAATLAIFAEARANFQAMNVPSIRIRSNGDLPSDEGGAFNWLDVQDEENE